MDYHSIISLFHSCYDTFTDGRDVLGPFHGHAVDAVGEERDEVTWTSFIPHALRRTKKTDRPLEGLEDDHRVDELVRVGRYG